MFALVQTSEAERIGVNQVAKVHATGNPTGADQCKSACIVRILLLPSMDS